MQEDLGLPLLEAAIGRVHWAKAKIQRARDDMTEAVQELIDAEIDLIKLRGTTETPSETPHTTQGDK